jgi:uncharacterized protein YdeI (YjbR/CyaY-like superfamily)
MDGARQDRLTIESGEFADREAFEKWIKQLNTAAAILWGPAPKKTKKSVEPK